ncbi:MAG: polysaccharide deacetylase family protein [Methylococcaceae bacterium]|nr:polysaccharide deacetylase family protein [Methylococcaceae bacterium]
MSNLLPSSNARGPIVLMYHGTPNNHPSSKYSIRADRFNAHLRYLKKQGWNTILFRELNTVSVYPKKTVVLTFDDGYADNFEGAFLPLVKNNMKATWFITTDCIGKHAHWMGSPSPQTQMLTAEQILQMEKAGMEIGSHTCSHPDLTTLSYDQQRDEMMQSKQILEAIIHGKIPSFAYPYGRHNSDSIEAAKDAAYQLACTVRPGDFDSEKNPLLVRRITIFATDSVSTLARKLAFADNDVSWKKMARYYYQRIKDKFIGNR